MKTIEPFNTTKSFHITPKSNLLMFKGMAGIRIIDKINTIFP